MDFRKPQRQKSRGGEVRGQGDHSLPPKHLLLITVSSNWLSRYLMSAPEKGLIYRRLRSSESKVCEAMHVQNHIQKDNTEPPFQMFRWICQKVMMYFSPTRVIFAVAEFH